MFKNVENHTSSRGNSSSAAANNNLGDLFAPKPVSRFNWPEILRREGTVRQTDNIAPVATVNMQSARSTGDLNELGHTMGNVDLNARTATSTPGGHHDDVETMATSVVEPSIEPTDVPIVTSAAPWRPLQNQTPQIATKPMPRSDRLLQTLNVDNAQGLLTPDGLVFVANLATHRSDQDLADSVSAVFAVFGRCVVKVRRDKHQHPFALVQYETPEAARRAISGSQNAYVDGRKIRTEVAQARRSLILYRNDGALITAAEVQGVLGMFGHIAEITPTTPADARISVPPGLWVKFSFYLDYKDVLNRFDHTNPLYKIRDGPNLQQLNAPVVRGRSSIPRTPTDMRSIFVGNLPFDTIEQEVIETFQTYGNVKLCNILSKPLSNRHYNVFGFVEFSTVYEARAASGAQIDLRGQRIRVEPKEYSARRNARTARRAPTYQSNSWGTPDYRFPTQPYAMPYSYQTVGRPLYGSVNDHGQRRTGNGGPAPYFWPNRGHQYALDPAMHYQPPGHQYPNP